LALAAADLPGRLARALLGAALLAGCGHRPDAGPRSAAEARAYHYQDSSGLLVGTYGAWVRQRLPGGTTAEVKALADFVRLDPDRGYDPLDPGADRRAPDAVTSASATAGGGQVQSEWRFEGQAGLDVDAQVAGVPVTAGGLVRASTEPDYRAVAGGARAAVALAERNTTVEVLLAYGHDRVKPVEVFRGQEAAWPASHQRVAAALALTQLLSTKLVAAAGLAFTGQWGALSSPYRRALVAPNLLLPEALPRTRQRYSGFLSLSASLTPRLALHLSQGAYVDSWAVRAFIPEAQVAAEVASGILLSLGYRLYSQGAADFYQSTYPDTAEVMAGDLRLGKVRDHTVSMDIRRGLSPSPHWQAAVLFGYKVSALEYRGVGARVVAHVFMLGMTADY
jgi:hypothetical protein